MTDRELLELAAKAAGNNAVFWVNDPFGLGHMRLPSGTAWSPLDDDGDALRLAVKLELPLVFCGPGFGYENTPENRRVMCGRYWDSRESKYEMFGQRYGVDKQAATRRVIVRAAAAEGALK